MLIRMTNCESTLLMEIASKKSKRKDIAFTYRMALEAEVERRERIDWVKINRAIIERWSESGLVWIKRHAWSGILE